MSNIHHITPKPENAKPPIHRIEGDAIDYILSIKNYTFFHVRNANTIYSLLVVYFIAVIIGYRERVKREEARHIELEKEKISSELEYLKQQINPHFLFNALNSIYSLTILNSEKSSDAVLKLSAMLRYMLYETDKNQVPLTDEIEMIDNYLGLQRLRLTPKTVINITKSGDFTPYRIEPMLLIPILENAIKYGVDSSNQSNIDIDINVSNGALHFNCANNIVKQNNDSKNSGIGIKNIRRRLDLLCSDYTLDIKQENNIFEVKLSIRFNS